MGDSDNNSDGTSEETISAYFVFFSTLLAVVLVLSKLLQDHARLARILPEAGMILLVGMLAGFLVHWVYGDERIGRARGMDAEEGDDDANVNVQQLVDNVLSFSPNAFFVALLPPIIFNSGYHLRRELFFRHMGPIALLAIVGTLVSTLVIAFFLKLITAVGLSGEDFAPTFTELLTFGALISATDPVSTLAVFQAKRVDPQLFYMVFGESVLNDAVGLVLFETFLKFVQRDNGAGKIAMGVMEFIGGFLLDAVASPLLGWICAIGAALLFKHVDFRRTKVLELSLFLLIMYVPFLVAEVLGLSGIVTILVSGIAARHYVEPNLSETTQDVADVIFRLTAHLAETSIFLELGLSVFGVTEFLEWRFIGWSLLACLMARACHVYPIVAFYNQSLQNTTTSKLASCSCFGYNIREGIREGMDGIMKMSKSNSEGGDAMASTKDDAIAKGTTMTKVRKPMSGNLELAEHLNDFSPHHPQERTEEDPTGSSSLQLHASVAAEAADPQQAPQQSPLSESPPLVRTVTADSDATLTPVPKRDLKIQSSTAHMVWFSGLRGAVAYACVRSFPDTFDHEREFMSTTMMIVLITVFAMGGATEAVLRFLDIEMNVNEDQYMEAWSNSEQAPSPGFWTYCDKRYVQRYVIRDYDPACAKNLHVATSGPILTKESSGHAGGAKGAPHKRDARNSIIASVREEDSSRSKLGDDASSRRNQQHDIEMTESGHYDTLHETGVQIPPARRRTSLFDYGMKSE